MSGHTPGPWAVTRDYSIVTDTTPAILLAKTYSANFAANAKLIAAAPDLGEALRDIAQFSDSPFAKKLAADALAKAGVFTCAPQDVGYFKAMHHTGVQS